MCAFRLSPAGLFDRLRVCLNLWPVNLYFVFTSLDKTSKWALLWGEGKHSVGEYRMPVIGSYFTARRRRGERLALHENHSKPLTVVLMRTTLTIQLQHIYIYSRLHRNRQTTKFSPWGIGEKRKRENKSRGLSNGILILRLGCLFVSLASFHLSPAVRKWLVLKMYIFKHDPVLSVVACWLKGNLALVISVYRSRAVFLQTFFMPCTTSEYVRLCKNHPIWQAFKYNTIARPTYIAG